MRSFAVYILCFRCDASVKPQYSILLPSCHYQYYSHIFFLDVPLSLHSSRAFRYKKFWIENCEVSDITSKPNVHTMLFLYRVQTHFHLCYECIFLWSNKIIYPNRKFLPVHVCSCDGLCAILYSVLSDEHHGAPTKSYQIRIHYYDMKFDTFLCIKTKFAYEKCEMMV